MANRVLVCGVLMAAAGAASAEPVSIGAFDRGWYNQAGFHDPGNDSYFCGDTTGNANDMGELRNWFAFDLSQMSARELVGARLELSSNFWFSDEGMETFCVSTVGFSREALMSGSGGVDAFAALGPANVCGEVTRTGHMLGPLVVTLSQEFVDALPWGGWLVLGGRLTTLSPRGAMFGSSSTGESGGAALPKLILDDGMPEVPLPGAAGMGMVGLCAVGLVRRRKPCE